MSLFPKLVSVLRRGQGSYVDGQWVVPAEPAPVTVSIGLQPAGPSDSDFIQDKLTEAGQTNTGVLIAYGDDNLVVQGDGAGDVVLHRGDRYLVVGSSRYDNLGPDTRHTKYLLVREVAREAGEA